MGGSRALILSLAIGLGRVARDHRQRRHAGNAVLAEHDRIDDELDVAHCAGGTFATWIQPENFGGELRHGPDLVEAAGHAAEGEHTMDALELRGISPQHGQRH